MRFAEERGDIISNWLVQLLVIMVVLGVLGFEGVSVLMANLSLDEDGREVAAAARSAYRDDRSVEDAIDAGRATAEERGIEVLSVLEVEEPLEVVFELERTANTLFLHRIGPLEGITVARTDRRVPLSPT